MVNKIEARRIKPRYQIGTAVNKEIYERYNALRNKKWSCTELLILGIEVAEKKGDNNA